MFELVDRIGPQTELQQVATLLARHFKFLADVVAWRYLQVVAGAPSLIIDGKEQSGTVTEADGLTPLEERLLSEGIPQALEGEVLEALRSTLPGPLDTVGFDRLLVIPLEESGPSKALLLAGSLASKGNLDLQFGRLAGRILHNRVLLLRTEALELLSYRLGQENAYLREELGAEFKEIVGGSPALQAVLKQVQLVAPTPANVLITGESGTGKELVARAIHDRSRRSAAPLVRVNCASVPRELFESEFFGHVQGAFTGAVKDRVGRFQLADGGTLFLDEVGEIPLELQSKLLRVLQEGTFEPVGSDRTHTVDVRLIAATNRDLKQEVETGRFRQDLYFRLGVFPLHLPPLRERLEDVGELAEHFLAQAIARFKLPLFPLTRAHVMQLSRYDWPGNVRELQNIIDRALITAPAYGELRFEVGGGPAPPDQPIPLPSTLAGGILTEAEMRELERQNLLAALKQAHWQVAGSGGAAELLEMKPTTLRSRMKALNIHRLDR